MYGIMGSGGDRSSRNGEDTYDEIDQIYDYVRGFAPLPKSAKGKCSQTCSQCVYLNDVPQKQSPAGY